MFKVLAYICVVLFATLARGGVLVQDGDYYPMLTVRNDSLLMTGGVVEGARLLGTTHTIEGGQLGVGGLKSVQHDIGVLNVKGGTWRNGISRSYDVVSSTINFTGSYFRYYDAGQPEENSYMVEGWLADGSFLSIMVSNATDRKRTRQLPINFIIEPREPLSGDTNLDWTVNLADLNAVRNHFGNQASRAEGDTDENGTVDLADLNLARNSFGLGPFSLSVGGDKITEVRESMSVASNEPAAVPEPTALAMLLAYGAAMVVWRAFI